MKDFEVHLGFPRKAEALCLEIAQKDAAPWALKSAMEVLSGTTTQRCADPHGVPGSLGTLATRRFSTPQDAAVVVDQLALRCSSEPDVRIELEEVLLTQLDEDDQLIQEIEMYDPDSSQFDHACLIPDTPPYEAHFGIRRLDGKPLGMPTGDFLEIARSVDVPVDEIVRFGPAKEKVICTTFFFTYDEMRERVQPYGRLLRDALHRFDRGLHLKLVAERIILCAEPRTTSLPSS